MMPPFIHAHAGRDTWANRLRYRLKECWILVLVVVPLALRGHGTVMVHNSVQQNARFTDDFEARRAGELDLRPDLRIDAFGQSTAWTGLSALLAVLIAALPRRWLLALVRRILARRASRLTEVVQFFDAHLSGFILALALKALGVRTATLQHGLYLASDRGSVMGLGNFVSDRVFLWDSFTEAEFRACGHASQRLCLTGQYGFAHTTPEETPDGSADRPARIALCPSYHAARVRLFQTIAGALPDGMTVVFSLHPLLRRQFADLRPRPIATMPRPRAAICGDSGAIMDCLARGIPVVTVAERDLAHAHVPLVAAPTLTGADWAALIAEAEAALSEDRARFGFTPLPRAETTGSDDTSWRQTG